MNIQEDVMAPPAAWVRDVNRECRFIVAERRSGYVLWQLREASRSIAYHKEHLWRLRLERAELWVQWIIYRVRVIGGALRGY
jgi:hypothetical protein